MSSTAKTLLKVLLSVALASVILYFVFRKIDFSDFWEKAKNVEYGWVLLSMFVSLFGYILRAYRWKLQLEPLGFKPTTYRMFLAVMSGYLANLVIPRLGEVTRCGVLNKSDKVPISTSFGTVITERIIDVLALGVIVLLTLLFQSEQLIAFANQAVDFNLNWTLIIGLLIVVLGGGAFVFFKFIYPSQTKIGEFSRNLIAGLISLKDVKLGGFLISTVLIWVVYFFMSYLVIFAMSETQYLSWQAGLSILSAGVIAFVLPVQSGFGTFHALVAAMLALYGIEHSDGVFFATLLHSSQLIAILIFGLVAVVLSVFIKVDAKSTENTDARAGA